MHHEIGLREARQTLGDLANRAHLTGDITYLMRNGRRIAAIVPISLVPQEPAMTLDRTVQIASRIPGRTIATYPLLDEIADAHGLSRSEAHDAIHAMLDQLVALDSDGVILDSQPMRPELLHDNPGDVDVYYWLTISEETAQGIRDAIAEQRTHDEN